MIPVVVHEFYTDPFFDVCSEHGQKLFRKFTILKTYHPNMKSKHLPTNTIHSFEPPRKQISDAGFFCRTSPSPPITKFYILNRNVKKHCIKIYRQYKIDFSKILFVLSIFFNSLFLQPCLGL